jgi:hypothetical protein
VARVRHAELMVHIYIIIFGFRANILEILVSFREIGKDFANRNPHIARSAVAAIFGNNE